MPPTGSSATACSCVRRCLHRFTASERTPPRGLHPHVLRSGAPMRRFTALLLLVFAAACGGSRPAQSHGSTPELDPGAGADAEQYADADSFALPPAPEVDSLIPPEEIAAE